MKKALFLLIGFLTLVLAMSVNAQEDLAATLEVLSAGVTVQRVNTNNPIRVNVEAIVGVGDIIRTDDTGRARITFFADGTDTELLPNTEYRLEQFTGNESNFTLSANIIAGQTRQRLGRILDANSTYTIRTPGMALAARGTTFDIRVEESGRSAMLVAEGIVTAQADDESADVSQEFGVRAESEAGLSDVVLASSFAELDAALDGCVAAISSFDDTRINVRVGPSIDLPRIGTIAADEIALFLGTIVDGNWYRIEFRDNFGWVFSSTAEIATNCAGLRIFDAGQVEDLTRYSSIGDVIELDLSAPLSTPQTPDELDEDAQEEANIQDSTE